MYQGPVKLLGCGHTVLEACVPGLNHGEPFLIKCASCGAESPCRPQDATKQQQTAHDLLESIRAKAAAEKEAGEHCKTHNELKKSICLEPSRRNSLMCSECKSDTHKGMLCGWLVDVMKQKRFMLKDKTDQLSQWILKGKAQALDLMEQAVKVGLTSAEEAVPAPTVSSEQPAAVPSHLNRFGRFGDFFLSSSDYFNELRTEALVSTDDQASGFVDEPQTEDCNETELMRVHRQIHQAIQAQLKVVANAK